MEAVDLIGNRATIPQMNAGRWKQKNGTLRYVEKVATSTIISVSTLPRQK